MAVEDAAKNLDPTAKRWNGTCYLDPGDQEPVIRFKKWAMLHKFLRGCIFYHEFRAFPVHYGRGKDAALRLQGKDGLKRNTGLMTALPYPVILRV